MRRFLIWTLLAAVVGVALAAGGFWAYWSMYARFQPVTITRNQAEIQRLLDASPYLSAERGGVPIWIVGYRDSAATQAFAGAEADRLRAGGIEPRHRAVRPPRSRRRGPVHRCRAGHDRRALAEPRLGPVRALDGHLAGQLDRGRPAGRRRQSCAHRRWSRGRARCRRNCQPCCGTRVSRPVGHWCSGAIRAAS